MNFNFEAMEKLDDLLKNQQWKEALKTEGLREKRKFVKFTGAVNWSNIVDDFTEEEMMAIQPAEELRDTLTLSADRLVEDVKMAMSGNRAPKQLLGATGVGKTTAVPMLMAEYVEGSVVVIEPSEKLATSVYDYMSAKHRGMVALDVNAGDTPSDAKVVYTTAQQFLRHIISGYHKLAGISVVILDEAHDMSNQYTALKAYLSARGAGWYVFHVSATFRGRNADVMRTGHALTKEVIEPVDVVNKVELDGTVLAAKNMSGRTMIIMPSSEIANHYVSYYRLRGVQVLIITHETDTDEYRRVYDRLIELDGRIVVLLCDSSVEYGVTLPINSVIDCGLKETMNVNPDTGMVTYGYRALTNNEATQRGGRAGRILGGTAKLMKHAFVSEDSADRFHRFYVCLWLRLLGIEPSVDYAKTANLLGPLTKREAMSLLSMPLFPLHSVNYLRAGKAYANVYNALSDVHCTSMIRRSNDVLEVARMRWETFGYHGARLKSPVPIEGQYSPATLFLFAVRAATYVNHDVTGDNLVRPYPKVVRKSIIRESSFSEEEHTSPIVRVPSTEVVSPSVERRARELSSLNNFRAPKRGRKPDPLTVVREDEDYFDVSHPPLDDCGESSRDSSPNEVVRYIPCDKLHADVYVPPVKVVRSEPLKSRVQRPTITALNRKTNETLNEPSMEDPTSDVTLYKDCIAYTQYYDMSSVLDGQFIVKSRRHALAQWSEPSDEVRIAWRQYIQAGYYMSSDFSLDEFIRVWNRAQYKYNLAKTGHGQRLKILCCFSGYKSAAAVRASVESKNSIMRAMFKPKAASGTYIYAISYKNVSAKTYAI